MFLMPKYIKYMIFRALLSWRVNDFTPAEKMVYYKLMIVSNKENNIIKLTLK